MKKKINQENKHVLLKQWITVCPKLEFYENVIQLYFPYIGNYDVKKVKLSLSKKKKKWWTFWFLYQLRPHSYSICLYLDKGIGPLKQSISYKEKELIKVWLRSNSSFIKTLAKFNHHKVE